MAVTGMGTPAVGGGVGTFEITLRVGVHLPETFLFLVGDVPVGVGGPETFQRGHIVQTAEIRNPGVTDVQVQELGAGGHRRQVCEIIAEQFGILQVFELADGRQVLDHVVPDNEKLQVRHVLQEFEVRQAVVAEVQRLQAGTVLQLFHLFGGKTVRVKGLVKGGKRGVVGGNVVRAAQVNDPLKPDARVFFDQRDHFLVGGGAPAAVVDERQVRAQGAYRFQVRAGDAALFFPQVQFHGAFGYRDAAPVGLKMEGGAFRERLEDLIDIGRAPVDVFNGEGRGFILPDPVDGRLRDPECRDFLRGGNAGERAQGKNRAKHQGNDPFCFHIDCPPFRDIPQTKQGQYRKESLKSQTGKRRAGVRKRRARRGTENPGNHLTKEADIV